MTNGSTLRHWVLACSLAVGLPGVGYSQTETPVRLSELTPSSVPALEGSWKKAGTVWFDPANPKKRIQEPGDAIFINDVAVGSPLDLPVGGWKQLYLEFEFMLSAAGSVQVLWGAGTGISFTSQRAAYPVSGRSGALIGPDQLPPRVAAGKAPGLWQHARISLSAAGWLEGVTLNDVVLHHHVKLATQLSNGSGVAFQALGDVALRNIRYTTSADTLPSALGNAFEFPTARAIIVTPHENPIVQRCFIEDGTAKRTYCVAVGEPQGIHYVVDQAQANLLGVWKGEFYDASTMWISRGEPQVAQPLGHTVWFDGKPLLASLPDSEAQWPDSAQSGLAIKSYSLDQERRPTFHYTFNGLSLTDKVVPSPDFQLLERTLSISGTSHPNTWVRIAAGKTIHEVEKGRYAVDDHAYYVDLPRSKGIKTVVRQVNGTTELLAAATADMVLTYSMYW